MPDPGFMLVGAALNRADGERIELSRLPSAVCDALLARRRDEAPDQWVILGSFEGDRRGGQRWRFASGLMVDLDYEDPAVPRDEGSHQAIPDELRGRIIEALADFPVAGFAYLTPRGLRWGCVFDKDVDDPETYAELVDLAAQQLLEHLAVHAVPLWREGVTGLRYDTASGKPEQAMRLPLSGAEVILTGEITRFTRSIPGTTTYRVFLSTRSSRPTSLRDAVRSLTGFRSPSRWS